MRGGRGEYLVSAFLQKALHKLPVGLSDDGGGQVGQLGLPDGGAQVPSLLDVLLQHGGESETFPPSGFTSLYIHSPAIY